MQEYNILTPFKSNKGTIYFAASCRFKITLKSIKYGICYFLFLLHHDQNVRIRVFLCSSDFRRVPQEWQRKEDLPESPWSLEASPVDSCLVRGSSIETSGLWAVLAGINLRPWRHQRKNFFVHKMNRCSQQSAAQNVVTLRIMAATEPRTPEGDQVGQPPDWPLFIDKAGRLPHLYLPTCCPVQPTEICEYYHR